LGFVFPGLQIHRKRTRGFAQPAAIPQKGEVCRAQQNLRGEQFRTRHGQPNDDVFLSQVELLSDIPDSSRQALKSDHSTTPGSGKNEKHKIEGTGRWPEAS
jgi:hypothetical protein